MLSPSTRYLAPSREVIGDDLYNTVRRPHYHRSGDRWRLNNEIGSGILPPLAFNPAFKKQLPSQKSRLCNSFLSALAAAEALGSEVSPKTFPFPVGESLPGTISGYNSVSRLPVAVLHRQIPWTVQQHEPPRFGILRHFSFLTCVSHTAHVIDIGCTSVRPSVCPSVCPSHAGIVSKQLNLSSNCLHCLVAP